MTVRNRSNHSRSIKFIKPATALLSGGVGKAVIQARPILPKASKPTPLATANRPRTNSVRAMWRVDHTAAVGRDFRSRWP